MQGNVEGIEKVFVSTVFVNDYLKSLHRRLYRKIIQFNPYLLSIEQIVSVWKSAVNELSLHLSDDYFRLLSLNVKSLC